MIRRLLPLSILAALVLAIPATASAKVNVAVGIGDQSPKMFTNASWQALKVKKARYFIHWDAASKPAELAKADAYLAAALQANVKVLMHVSTNSFNAGAKLPSVAEYKTAVGALVSRYKKFGVTEWGVWNEANHKTQPTYKNPKRAADFYKAMKGFCKGCKIVALDVLDQSGVESYISRWMKAAGSSGKSAKIIGIHNYSEVNRRLKEKGRSKSNYKRYPGTRKIVDAVRAAGNKNSKFWYTETGGVVNFGSAFACNETRPVSRNKFMFDMAKRYDKLFERLYTYNLFGTSPKCNGFDAGLLDANGAPRPAYAPFKKAIANFTR